MDKQWLLVIGGIILIVMIMQNFKVGSEAAIGDPCPITSATECTTCAKVVQVEEGFSLGNCGLTLSVGCLANLKNGNYPSEAAKLFQDATLCPGYPFNICCIEPATTTCIDTDGTNIYSRGTVTLSYSGGGQSTYTDWCQGNLLTEYYCQNNYKSEILQNCPTDYTCSNGACVQQSCNTPADTDCNGVISTLELQTYGQKWLNSQITRTQIGQAIQDWSGG